VDRVKRQHKGQVLEAKRNKKGQRRKRRKKSYGWLLLHKMVLQYKYASIRPRQRINEMIGSTDHDPWVH